MSPRIQSHHTSLNLSGEHQAALRELAARLGHIQTRGPGKSTKAGSISALVAAIADAYRTAPDFVAANMLIYCAKPLDR